jgi:hypothetical protein
MPPTLTTATDVARELLDREAALDALHRFAAGQDLKDPELFESAFAPTATLDFTQPSRRFGGDVPVMPDRGAIMQILDVLAPMVVTHSVTNARVAVDGDRGQIAALVEAQHIERAAPWRHLLLKNHFTVDVERDGERFVITRMVIENIWATGEPSVLFPGSTVTPGLHVSDVPTAHRRPSGGTADA